MESAAVVPPPLPLKMRHQCQHIPLHCQTVHTSSASSSSSSSRSSASSISTSANHLPSHQKTPPEVRITSSSAAGSGSSATVRAEKNQHVVKIRISPDQVAVINKDSCVSDSSHGVAQIRICVNSGSDNMMTSGSTATTAGSDSTYYFNFNPFSNLPSGQISPSDTLDSGTCSDLDSTPPPLPTKKKAGLGVATATSAARISVTVIGHTESNNRAASVSSSGAEVDSDNDSESNISCDSLNSGDLPPQLELEHQKSKTPSPTLPAFEATTNTFPASSQTNTFLPQGLLQDIRRQRNTDSNEAPKSNSRTVIVNESTYEDREIDKVKQAEKSTGADSFETDCYYNFHLKENIEEQTAVDSSLVSNVSGGVSGHEDESFAGYKDLFSGGNGSSTIRSAKGTVRGVKNRVRAGIATFLQINSNVKSYKEKDAGKVVVYTTTMSVIRNTTQACTTVKQILRTLLVKFEERDVFMSGEYQAEIRDRMRCDSILVPQVFVDGQHIGDAETIERLNETGELRKILKPYKSMDACSTCQVCGGYRLLPCSVCNGSKKSVHRNHFTAEFVALKCMNCDEVGLVKCTYC